MKRLLVLGATGSVGKSVLDVAERHADRISVVGLAARRASPEFIALCRKWRPKYAATSDPADETVVRVLKAEGLRISSGPLAVARMVEEADADACVAAICGTAGLESAFAAAARGMEIILANKEIMVSAGEAFNRLVKKNSIVVRPLDSEHSGIAQCLDGRDGVDRVFITASGGPFRGRKREEMQNVTPAEALRHPVWSMGGKISVDSATLANKALEVIEAHFLFGFSYEQIHVLVHPQSIVHALVEFIDGSVLAHMGVADMRLPAQYALLGKERAPGLSRRLNLLEVGRLTFEPPDLEAFPMLGLGIGAGKAGGGAPTVFNAANERAVELFLHSALPFHMIYDAVEEALTHLSPPAPDGVDAALDIHRAAAAAVDRLAAKQTGR